MIAIDKTMRATLLPSELIIKGFVQGEPDCNYEKYMLELVNASAFFLEKSDGKLYSSPLSEANGECDCISEKYKMDFKLIASKTALQARSILSDGKITPIPGFTMTVEPKAKKSSMDVTRIHVALRYYDFVGLCELRNCKIKKQGIENDIIELLKTLETKKNLILFFPYDFTFESPYNFDSGVEQIEEALNNDFKNAVQYRKSCSEKLDTYMAFVYDDKMVFMKEFDGHFKFVDSVDLSTSSTFIKLSRYI